MSAVDLANAIVVDFPLRGEWVALNTPAERVPSHGTDYFGQRYAFDFVQVGSSTSRFHRQSFARHLLGIVPASDFHCWDRPVYASFSGRVILTGDGLPDRMRVNALVELARVSLFPSDVRGSDYRPLLGNFVMVEGASGVAVYAHLRNGGVCVQLGQHVSAGAQLGTVGNSGNSTMPHLHFHVMDDADPLTATGVLCAFRRLEHFVEGVWTPIEPLLPKRDEPVRPAAG